MYSKVVLRIVLFLAVFLAMSTSVFSNCAQNPSYYEITSGDDTIGSFKQGNLAYIRGDLEQYPLGIKAVFENTQSGCFSDASDMKMRLTSSSIPITANQYEEIEINETSYESHFIFEFSQEDLQLNSEAQMQYSLEENNYVNGVVLSPDNQEPQIVLPDNLNTNIGPNQEVSFTFSVEDSESGLDLVEVNSNLTNLSGEKTFEKEFSRQLNDSMDVTIRAKDMLSQSSVEIISFEVDNEGPEFRNFNNLGSSYNGIEKTVSFSIDILEDNFDANSQIKENIQVEEVNSNVLETLGKPNRCSQGEEGIYTCNWEEISIKAEETTSINLNFSGTDRYENSNSNTVSTSIFIDSNSPTIEKFEVETGTIGKNIISGYSDNVEVVLEVNDETLADLSVTPTFDLLKDNAQGVNCGIGCYRWDISENVEIYKQDTRDEVSFDVEVSDMYDNVVRDSITVEIDNYKPSISNISIAETGGVRDRVFKSGEKVTLEISFEEENFDEDGIYGNFVSITGNSNMNNVSPSTCRELEENNHTCYFENIELGTGYFERNATVVINDEAGNRAVSSIPVEVLKVNENEIPTAFTIDNIEILNPLNRNLFSSDGSANTVTGWFEGEINSIEDSFEIVNYEFNECNASFVAGAALKQNSPRLYPHESQTQLNSQNISEFVLRSDLDTRGSFSPNNLQDTNVSCSVFLLFRDDTTLYEPGVPLNFTLEYQFFDLPRGNLLRAHAKNLDETIEESQILGETFDDIYEIYSILNTVCNTLSTVSAMWGTVKNAIDPMSNGLKSYVLTYGIGKSIDEGTTPTQGALSELGFEKGGLVDKFCGYLSCQYGTIDSTQNILESMNQIPGDMVCSRLSSGGGE